MRRYSERSIALTLAAALLLLPLHASGSLTVFTEPLLEGVESLVAGPVGTAVLPDARTVAARRLAFRTRELIRRCGERAPSVGTLMPQITLAREAALRHGIPVSLILAVIHRESGFQQEAVSPVGAVGLMQVMPAVARSLARSEGLPLPRWLELLDSRRNIEIGSTLLSRLHQRYGSWERALAAYNAGDRAFGEDGIRDDVRAYVKRVKAGARLLSSLLVPTARPA